MIGSGDIRYERRKWITSYSPIGLIAPPGKLTSKTAKRRIYPFAAWPIGAIVLAASEWNFSDFETRCALDETANFLTQYSGFDRILKEQQVMRGMPMPETRGAPIPAIMADLDTHGLSASETMALSEVARLLLYRSGHFILLSRADMNKVLSEHRLSMSDHCSSTTCLIEMGKLLDVQVAIGGTINRSGNSLRVKLNAVDVQRGTTLAEEEDTLVFEQNTEGDLTARALKYMCAMLLHSYCNCSGKSWNK